MMKCNEGSMYVVKKGDASWKNMLHFSVFLKGLRIFYYYFNTYDRSFMNNNQNIR